MILSKVGILPSFISRLRYLELIPMHISTIRAALRNMDFRHRYCRNRIFKFVNFLLNEFSSARPKGERNAINLAEIYILGLFSPIKFLSETIYYCCSKCFLMRNLCRRINA